MKTFHYLLFCSSSLIVLIISGCASNLTTQDVRAIGRPEIVYVQPHANLVAFEGNAYGAGGALGILLTAEINRDINGVEQISLDRHAEEIKKLGFNEQTYATFSSVVAATPWLSGIKIQTLPNVTNEDAYTRQSKADSVIYLKPIFSMAPGNQTFVVDVTVEVQKRDDKNQKVVHNFRSQEFRFRHHLSLVTPGMSWEEQKEVTHKVASMSSEEALETWLDNNGALLRADFSQDIRQINEGLKQFFGDQPG